MRTKTFDCVEMKHRGALLLQKKLKRKSLAQKLDFWQKETEELKKAQKSAKKRV